MQKTQGKTHVGCHLSSDSVLNVLHISKLQISLETNQTTHQGIASANTKKTDINPEGKESCLLYLVSGLRALSLLIVNFLTFELLILKKLVPACNSSGVNSGSWDWTRRPGVLQSMGSQRVGHN